MDLAAAQNLLAGSIAQQTGQDGRWQWGRWDGNSVYLDDAPDVPLIADNAAGDLLPGSRVYCQLVGRRVIIHGPVKPIPESTRVARRMVSGTAPRMGCRSAGSAPRPHLPRPAPTGDCICCGICGFSHSTSCCRRRWLWGVSSLARGRR